MALLNNEDRRDIWRDFMRSISKRREPIGDITKQQLRELVDAADQWVNDNASSYNFALPLPPRNALSAKQKAEMLMFIVHRRFERA